MNRQIETFAIKGTIMMIVLMCFIAPISAQKKRKKILENTSPPLESNTATYLIKLKDETTLMGQIIQRVDSTKLVIKTQSIERLEISTSQIQSMEKVDNDIVDKGPNWFKNPAGNKYLIAQSAFTVKENHGYVQSIYGLYNSVTYGFSDHFSIGAGTELSTLISGTPILTISPKLAGYKLGDKWHAGVASNFIFYEDGVSGLAYGMITRGTEDTNITFGTGLIVGDGTLSKVPFFNLSGMVRLSKNFSLIAENWLLPREFDTFDGYLPLLSGGVRFFGKNLAIDLTILTSPELFDDAVLFGIPFADLTYKF